MSKHPVDLAELSAYHDDALGEEERRRVEDHLASCPSCRERLADYTWMGNVLRSVPEPPVPLAVDVRVRALLREEARPKPRWSLPPLWAPRPALAAVVLAALLMVALLAGLPIGTGGSGPLVASAFLYNDQGSPAIEVKFDTAVDRDSVAKSVQLEPAVEVNVSWRGDSTMVIKPAKELQPSEKYTLTLKPKGAESATTPVALQFAAQVPATPVALATQPPRPQPVAVVSSPTASPAAAAKPSTTGTPASSSTTAATTTPGTATATASTPAGTATPPAATTGTAVAGVPAATPGTKTATPTGSPAAPTIGTATPAPAAGTTTPTTGTATPAPTAGTATPTAAATSTLPTGTPTPPATTTPSTTDVPTPSRKPTRTPTAPALGTPQATATTPSAEATPEASTTSTATPAETATEIPTATPTETATPTAAPIQGVGLIFEEDPAIAQLLGAPRAAALPVQVTRQTFERGTMLSRSDTREVFVLQRDGTWYLYRDSWQDGESLDDTGSMPPGLLAPIQGFGKLWRQQAELRQSIGWATAAEQSQPGLVQEFAGGRVLETADHAIYILYLDGSWQSLPDPYPTPTPVVTPATP